jgi:hypothetical protein
MQNRGTSGILLVVTLLAGVALGAAAATGRLPLLTQTWKTVASSVASSLPSSVASIAESLWAPDAGVSTRDAGTLVHRQTAPLSSTQLGSPLVRGTFIGPCGAPDDMKIVINATVRMGRAVDVSVKTEPPNTAVAACIERATRDQQWDISPKTDHVTVTY